MKQNQTRDPLTVVIKNKPRRKRNKTTQETIQNFRLFIKKKKKKKNSRTTRIHPDIFVGSTGTMDWIVSLRTRPLSRGQLKSIRICKNQVVSYNRSKKTSARMVL